MNTNMVTKLCLCAAVMFVAAPLFAADDPADNKPAPATNAQETHAKHFDLRINTWAEGAVTSIDYDGNSLKVHGKQLPLASAHAQMKKDCSDRMKNADATQREKIAADVKQDWKERLEKARTATATEQEKDFTLTFATDGKVKDEAELARHRLEMIGKPAAQGEQAKAAGEKSVVDIYEVPENTSIDQNAKQTGKASDNINAGKAQENPLPTSNEPKTAASKLSIRDIKTGDKVMVGFDAAGNQAFTIVLESKTSR